MKTLCLTAALVPVLLLGFAENGGTAEVVQRDFIVVESRTVDLRMDMGPDAAEVANYAIQAPQDTFMVLNREGDYYRVAYRSGQGTVETGWLHRDRIIDAFIVRDLHAISKTAAAELVEAPQQVLAAHPEWGAVPKTLIYSALSRTGMQPEQIRTSFGIPHEANKFRTASSEYEQWIYSPGADTSYVVNFRDGAMANFREVIKPPDREMKDLKFRSRRYYPYRKAGIELMAAGVVFLGGGFIIYGSATDPGGGSFDTDVASAIFFGLGTITEGLGIYLFRYKREDTPPEGPQVSMNSLRDGALFSLKYHF